MRADIHDGREQKRSIHGPDTEAQDPIPPSHFSACNARPVHTVVPSPDLSSDKGAAEVASWPGTLV